MAFEPISFQAKTTIPAYRIVTVLTGTGDFVKVPAATTEYPIGVTTDTVLDTALGIPVQVSGLAKVEAGDTIAGGAFVAAANDGRGAVHAAVSAGSYVIGINVGATATAGQLMPVIIQPQWIDLP